MRLLSLRPRHLPPQFLPLLTWLRRSRCGLANCSSRFVSGDPVGAMSSWRSSAQRYWCPPAACFGAEGGRRFYGLPAFLCGLVLAWIYSALLSLYGPSLFGRCRQAWQDEATDAAVYGGSCLRRWACWKVSPSSSLAFTVCRLRDAEEPAQRRAVGACWWPWRRCPCCRRRGFRCNTSSCGEGDS